ncbi:MAG: phytoene/squalene synthase family protein [Planctomycetota bacterium]
MSLVLPPEVVASYDYCRSVARRAGNFYRGMRLTPEPKRSAIFAIYAWMRQADDLADDHRPGNGVEAAARLAKFEQQTAAAIDASAELPEGQLWPAVRDTVNRYGIPAEYLEAMIDGQRSDLRPVHCQTFDDLYTYCYRVASVVGLTCVKVWGDDGDPAVKQLAEYRGVALQLTNILRDVAEDAQRGRVYLPAEDLARFGVGADRLSDGQGDEAFERLMRFQIERARSYYDMSATLERHLSPDCRSTCWAIMRTYRVLLERIAQRPTQVLTRRVSLPLPTKLAVVAGAVTKRTWA